MQDSRSGTQGKFFSVCEGIKVLQPPSAYWPESANIYILEDDGGLSLFDVGCGDMASADRLFGALKSLGWDSRPIKKIILSHAHPDHMGGMQVLLSEVEPELIAIHEIDLPYTLEPERLQFSFDIPLCKKRLAEVEAKRNQGTKGPDFDLMDYFRLVKCPMCHVQANRTVKDGDHIQVGVHNFEVLHTPGHAPGHISLYDQKERVLLAGDILGEMVAWYAPSSGGVTGYLESLDKVEALEIDLILPSHGDIITDAEDAIAATRRALLERDDVVLNSLNRGPKSFHELLELFFQSPSVQFFPGTPILESHLQRLEARGKIRRSKTTPERFFALGSVKNFV